jgi:acetylornithine deacetylase/succinyl-diaminopimelate desuccinylase-like protein
LVGLGVRHLACASGKALHVDGAEMPCVALPQVASALEKLLGAPALLVPFGQSSDCCHLANERLQRVNLVRGKNVIKHLLRDVATV